ncbi:hypothetical protein SDC9_179060 [bioreactor metagenome]|uniref:Uncharacterized protein n=1 Tax=bioreactor metagenome TaxID=1076179 RepID=A0A645GZB9_9ZZZZ
MVQPEFLSQRLKLAIQVFRADQAVFRMVRKEQIENRAARIDRPQRVGVNLHALRHRRTARRCEVRPPLDLDHADAAGTGPVFELETVHLHMAKGRDADIELLGSFQDRGAGLDGDRRVVDCQIDFHLREYSCLTVAQCFSTAWNLQTP